MLKHGFEEYNLKRTYSDGYKNTGRKGADFENDKYYMATVTYGIIGQINIFARLGMVGLDVDLDMNFKANIHGTSVSSTTLTLGTSYCF